MASAVHEYKYAVQVKGRFDLFANDDYNAEDPEHLLRKLKSQKQESKTPDVSTPEVVEKQVGKPVEANQHDRPRDVRGKGPRGRGGFSRNSVPPSGGQRQFDRHSGSDKTGVKSVMKKGGHGTGNWGTIEDELEAQTAEPVPEPLVEQEPLVEPAPEPEQAEEEEAPKTLTLKEYKEQKAKAKVELSTKGTRRPNDGKNVFSNMVEVHKSKPVETKVSNILEEEKQQDDKSKPVFFDFGRGRGPRPSGPGEFRGRGGAPRFQPRREERPETTEEDSSAPALPTDRPFSRGGRGGGERGRGFSRGRGGPRVSFNHERGGGRGGSFNHERGRGGGSFIHERGGPRGSFDHERVGGRGGSFNHERSGSFGHDRGGSFGHERGGRGGSFNHERGRGGGDRGGFRGGRGFRGGPRGAFRGGRDYPQEERHPDSTRNAAPMMDSEADFPALK